MEDSEKFIYNYLDTLNLKVDDLEKKIESGLDQEMAKIRFRAEVAALCMKSHPMSDWRGDFEYMLKKIGLDK